LIVVLRCFAISLCVLLASSVVGASVPYTVLFSSEDSGALKRVQSDLEALSISVQKIKIPPKSMLLLKKRAQRDQAEMRDFLNSQGYYDNDIAFAIDAEHVLRFQVDFGPQYVFDQVSVVLLPSDSQLSLQGFDYGGLRSGKKALASTVFETESALLAFVRGQRYALAKLLPHKVWIAPESHTMSVEYHVNTGPVVRLGAATLSGEVEVDAEFIQQHITWQENDFYTQTALNKTNQALLATGLFSSVQLIPAKALNAEGQLPVQLTVKERPFRSIGAGIALNTDSGITLNSHWEHRNYFGAGEKLSVEGQLSTQTSLLEGTFRKPNWWRRDQTLVLGAGLVVDNTEAFERTAVSLSSAVERMITPDITASIGVDYTLSTVIEESTEIEENFGLLSVPVRFAWQYTDNSLNPTQGGKFLFTGKPTVDTLNTSLRYVKGQVTLSHYWPLQPNKRLVFASRVSLGLLTGIERDAVPADERFYAGGGGSIRGYGFQLAGPLGDDENPLGGNSLFELSVELRYTVWKEVGVVAFVDTGSVYEADIPELNGLFTGVGVGLRYQTKIGPLRFDLAFPTNKREGIDDDFQIYISIGQAY